MIDLLKKEKNPKTILSYVETNLTDFWSMPFNEIDALVFCQIAYFKLNEQILPSNFKKTLKELYRSEYFGHMFTGTPEPLDNRRLLSLVAASPRFRDILIGFHESLIDTEMEKQFSATSFFLPDNTIFIVFRGTDKTFIGWKEDFNMLYMEDVPAQTEAKNYLEYIASKYSCALRVGGHSKGGTLAEYASFRCSDLIQSRIIEIYNMDGPNLQHSHLNSAEYKKMLHLIHKFVPKDSFFGMLSTYQNSYTVINSTASGGISQHNPFTWMIDIQNNSFKTCKDISSKAKNVRKHIHDFVTTLSPQERKDFVEALWTLMYASGEDNIENFQKNWNKTLPALGKAITSMDESTYKKIITGLQLGARK